MSIFKILSLIFSLGPDALKLIQAIIAAFQSLEPAHQAAIQQAAQALVAPNEKQA